VAHEDIEPTKEFETEMLLALNSAHALVAFLTPDFHESRWTDQEVGIALGRGILVISVSLDLDPYGFIAGKQAMRGSFENIQELAASLVDILLKHHSTSKLMHTNLVSAFENAKLYHNAINISQMIIKTNSFTQGQLSKIQKACKNNNQVVKAYGVPERIEAYLNKHGFKTDEVPF
jgi:hypothetical protein